MKVPGYQPSNEIIVLGLSVVTPVEGTHERRTS